MVVATRIMTATTRRIGCDAAIIRSRGALVKRTFLESTMRAGAVNARKPLTDFILDDGHQHRFMSVMVTNTKASSLQENNEPVVLEGETPSAIETEDLTISGACLQRVANLIAKKDSENADDFYLRVYVDAGGCSGFQYKFELTDEELDAEEDIVFANKETGARVVVDSSSLDLIRGSTIDFVQEMIKSSFVVLSNPQSESACGCGSSFAVKNFAANPALD